MRLPKVLWLLTACLHLLTASNARVLQADDGRSAEKEAPVTWPIIGILSQPVPSKNGKPPAKSYFAASYPKYVAMSGAQAVPVLCGTPKNKLKALYKQLNGLIVPGGGQDLRPGNVYYDTMSLIMDWAMEDFDESGEVFPIHFTCLGWEAVAVKVTSNPYILSNFTGAQGVAAPLHWTDNAANAWSHKYVTDKLRAVAEVESLAFESHHYGVWVPDFWGTELSDFFTLLSITPDAAGKQYVSMVEAKHYPFVAMQWHPEKTSFDMAASGHLVLHFGWVEPFFHGRLLDHRAAHVQKARNSTHRFDSAEALQQKLLYNHIPSHAENQTGGYFYEVYSFPFSPNDGNDGKGG